MKPTFVIATILTCALDSSAFGQAPANPPVNPPISKALQLTPENTPTPALKYQLLPDAKDLSTGNAVVLYYRAFSPEWHNWFYKERWSDRIYRWLQLPYDKAAQNQPTVTDESETELEPRVTPVKKSDLQFLKTSKQMAELDRAARRTYAEWELMERGKQEGITMMLPELQTFRSYAMLLRARARLQLMDGEFDKVTQSLQTSMAMACHVSDSGLIVNALTGLSIANDLCDTLEEYAQVKNAPNLYWALSNLPHPIFDLRRALQADRFFFVAGFPDLQDLEKRVYSKEEMSIIFNQVMTHLQRYSGGAPGTDADKITLSMLTAREYPQAKAWLASQGRLQQIIDAMPATQVVLLHALYRYQEKFDDYLKWYGFPPPVSRSKLLEVDKKFQFELTELDLSTAFVRNFLPSMMRIMNFQVSVERRLAMLCCVEALRDYAAKHQGQIPDTLDQITDLPLPPDPATGRPFQYAKKGDSATLAAPLIQPRTSLLGREYKLSIKK